MAAGKKLREAVDKVMDDITLSVKPVAEGEEHGSPADKQFLIRCTDGERELWRKAAEKSGKTMSAFARDLLNTSADRMINCQHPRSMRRSYPWAEFCLACNARLRG